jgi:hypothetical protein
LWSRGTGHFPSYTNVLMLWISAACCMRSGMSYYHSRSRKLPLAELAK